MKYSITQFSEPSERKEKRKQYNWPADGSAISLKVLYIHLNHLARLSKT